MASKGNTRHIRRLASSRYMKIGRKTSKYVIKPKAGRHRGDSSIALITVLKERIFDGSSREMRYALNNSYIEVNGKAVKDGKFPVGFGDVIHIKPSAEHYKAVSYKDGSFAVEKIEHARHKQIFKVIGKFTAKAGKEMVRLHDGRVLAAEHKVKVNDSVALGKKGIEKVIPLEVGGMCYVINGTHASETGRIKEVSKGTMLRNPTVKIESTGEGSQEFETLLRNIMVMGE